jgi:predicted transporter
MGIYKNGIESKMSGAVSHMQKSIHKFIPACLISNGIYNKKKMESTHFSTFFALNFDKKLAVE